MYTDLKETKLWEKISKVYPDEPDVVKKYLFLSVQRFGILPNEEPSTELVEEYYTEAKIAEDIANQLQLDCGDA